MKLYSDEYWMKEALKEAYTAFNKDEIPVGAVIVCNQIIVARAHNYTETLNDVTAHAEMQAFTMASEKVGKYLKDCTLYVTLEPCIMCAGAAYWTQIGKIVFGAYDKKRGYQTVNSAILHPKTIVKGGVLEEESKKLLQLFFQKKR